MVQPSSGPEGHPKRFQMAVDICSTHAALGSEGFVGPQWYCLFHAGVVFGGSKRYPLESDWIHERCREIAGAFPVLAPVMESMPAAWASEKVHWNALGALWRSQKK